MLVYKVEKLLILVIWNKIFACGLTHAGDRGWSPVSVR
jgi:hypothetical protein